MELSTAGMKLLKKSEVFAIVFIWTWKDFRPSGTGTGWSIPRRFRMELVSCRGWSCWLATSAMPNRR